jgi:hypothetical protein
MAKTTYAKFNPHIRTFIVGPIAIILFSIPIYFFFSIGPIDTTENIEAIVVVLLTFGIFIFFAVMSCYAFFSIKVVTLTDDALTIFHPILLWRTTIFYKDIQTCYSTDYSAHTKHGTSIFTGSQVIIRLHNGKIKTVNSFELDDLLTFFIILSGKLKKIDKNIVSVKSSDKITSYVDRSGLVLITVCTLLILGLKFFI